MAIGKKLVKTHREVTYSIIFFMQHWMRLLPDKEQIMVATAIKKLTRGM
jgi:hypothetical protein